MHLDGCYYILFILGEWMYKVGEIQRKPMKLVSRPLHKKTPSKL